MRIKQGTVALPQQPGGRDCRMHGQLRHRQFGEAMGTAGADCLM